MPTIDAAMQNMKNSLMACKRRGFKAAILIHGYGSTGVGGGIRSAARRCLGEADMRGIVRDFIGGEQWHWRKKELLAMYRDLAPYEGRVSNNEGVTVVLLK